MDWLNYHHLYYFWTVAREGSIARATHKLHLAQPTISTQLKALDRALGHALFEREGRGLKLTEAGKVALRYAEEIFSLGRELCDALADRPPDRPLRLQVGVSQVIPKLIVDELLGPALGLGSGVRLVCHEGKLSELLTALSTHELDVVLADQPADPAIKVKVFSHLLGECGVTFFATRPLAARLRRKFPGSLAGAPWLAPGPGTVLRRSLEQWFEGLGLEPRIAGEFDDSALLKAFGQRGLGVFASPSAIEREVRRQYRVNVVGRTEDVREKFYAISVDRRLRHPAVTELARAARERLFAGRGRQ